MGDLGTLKLYNAIRRICESYASGNKGDTMVYGTVKTVDPLSVDIGKNVVLTEEFLFLGQMCRPHKVTVPHSHIVDAMLSEKSPSLNGYSNVIVANAPVEVPSVPEAVAYNTFQDNGRMEEAVNGSVGEWNEGTGEEISNTVNDLTNGSRVSFSGSASGQAVFNGMLKVEDKKHSHIIGRHKTLDVHFPTSDYEESVTIEIEPKLKVGDTVLLFAFNNYQKYYVAERIEE